MVRTMIAAAVAAGLFAAPFAISSTSAQTSAPAPAAQTAKSKRPVSAGQQMARERQKKCGAEWKEAKAAGKVDKAMTWPKYWSACNKRLKAGG